MTISKATIKSGEELTLIDYLTPESTQISKHFELESGAKLLYIQVSRTLSVGSSELTFDLSQGASLEINTVDIDNQQLTRELQVNLNGEASTAKIEGLYISDRAESVTNNLKVSHFVSNCQSSQLYKGIVGGTSSFNGHIYIERDAQQSVALQENHNILLHDDAKVKTHPWLEIYADDVKCNHGATVGKNDDQAIYYMRQRGISEPQAKWLLMQGFVEQCVAESSEHEQIVEMIQQRLEKLQ
ncbi:MAG: SufD family Fe-S cluster assembly protein [Rikenellaceae bacterium]